MEKIEKLIKGLEKQIEEIKKFNQFLNIEISKSIYAQGKWNLRVGDITGSTESSNISLEEVMKEIKEAMKDLKLKNE